MTNYRMGQNLTKLETSEPATQRLYTSSKPRSATYGNAILTAINYGK